MSAFNSFTLTIARWKPLQDVLRTTIQQARLQQSINVHQSGVRDWRLH
jgi:hypothetical protein